MSSHSDNGVTSLRFPDAHGAAMLAYASEPPPRMSLKELAARWGVNSSTAGRRIRRHKLLVMKEGDAASCRVYVDPRQVFALERTWGWHRDNCA